MRKEVKAIIQNGRVTRTRKEIWHHVIHATHELDFVKIEISHKLTHAKDALRRLLLCKQILKTAMIGINLKFDSLQKMAPFAERHLRRQRLHIAAVVTILSA